MALELNGLIAIRPNRSLRDGGRAGLAISVKSVAPMLFTHESRLLYFNRCHGLRCLGLLAIELTLQASHLSVQQARLVSAEVCAAEGHPP